MYQLNAFMVINDLIDNTLNTTSVLGELSQNSYSFTREVGYYSNELYKEVRLITFYSFEDGVKKPLPQNLADELLQLGNWLAEQSISRQITENRSAFIQSLTANYQSKLEIKNVGKMVTNGTYYLPEYITFSLVTDTRENLYRIWFSDEAFQNQYDNYEIEVVAPFANVDDFLINITILTLMIKPMKYQVFGRLSFMVNMVTILISFVNLSSISF